jgi:hypothetical protein
MASDKLILLTGDTSYIGHVGSKIRRGLFEFFAALSEYDYLRGKPDAVLLRDMRRFMGEFEKLVQ